MIKKNLIILLLIPFLIALIGAAAVKTTYKIIDNDIKDIKWKYGDVEAFKVNNSFLLEAESVADGEIDEENKLIWSIENKDKTDTKTHAKIRVEGDNYYLDTLEIGNIILTCSNKKGNVCRSTNAIIYDHGAILISAEIQSSQTNIDSQTYYGQYDLVEGEKKNASFNLNVRVVPKEYENNLYIDSTSSNIKFDLTSKVVEINDIGDAHITIGCNSLGVIEKQSYTFNVVKDGINVYNYDTLLACTNKSTDGEIVVLRKSFESLDNYNQNSELNNICLFGNYDSKTKKFNFNNEIYKYKTTYNNEFITKWNNNAQSASNPEPLISDTVYAGLRIQKDIYGNGYTLNMHNLTYPTGTSTLSDGLVIPTLMPDDLFRGPLPFYALGDHNNMPLIECFGEDNSGLYIDGNNITINDINMKNCDFKDSLGFLDYVGTVININGSNNTIINSRVSNGKNVIRAFSTQNLTIKNSLLSNARNFLLYAGSNEYVKPNETKEYEFTLYDGTKVTSTIKEFFKKDGLGDELLTQYCSGEFDDWFSMYQAIQSTQNALCDDSELYDSNNNLIYKGSIDITDVYFYRSGVSSIGLDTMFDGAYLYSSLPSLISTYLGKLQTQKGNLLSELLTSNTGGQSYPIILNLNGNTNFYDYKETSSIDISGLIAENMSAFAHAYDPTISVEINIDKIFPIKEKILSQAEKQGSIYKNNDKDYICCPIAYYGGGYNYNKVTFNDAEIEGNLSKDIRIDLLSEYVKLPKTSATTTMVKYLMQKTVTVATGYTPFRFVCVKDGYLYGETPKISDLKNN